MVFEKTGLGALVRKALQYHQIRVIPESDLVNEELCHDISTQLLLLARKYGVEDDYVNCGYNIDVEAMREDDYEPPESGDIPNKYVFIHVRFRTDFAANRFLLGVINDTNLKFRAERFDRPMGLARYMEKHHQ